MTEGPADPVPQRDAAEVFEARRPRLLSLAYRLTGSVADAEDAVQDSWLRLAGADLATIDDPDAWLTTVTTRVCLDRLRSAAVRRERYVGQWLPEPIVRPLASAEPDPLDAVIAAGDVRLALMVVLDTLPPAQRTALVLHDVFDVPFARIAEILDATPAAARQHASRARRAVAALPEPISPPEHDAVIERLHTAIRGGDLNDVVAALHADVEFVGDADGTTPTALRGPDHVARFLLGLAHRYGGAAIASLEPVAVNGGLGFVAGPAMPPRVTAFSVADGRVRAVYDVANRAKHRGVRLGQDSAFTHGTRQESVEKP
ncbi:RNA polymerase sigma factor SigJ [Rhodococcus rhodnii LMG 5362]|uniref:RNA polymerase sigma factor SigJ n=1 Tax=Rhodococcus rhodnii LMG 5362 TaxID=1273125 RepID=R7WRE8_9NOCA|nr:RNA polymerase sigma factor SigJ [Rhodococcus rhodnii]EOM77871.1 RNA polymerase sigma factor SigJ [Rhodococcus rhodnii LMG 5362]